MLNDAARYQTATVGQQNDVEHDARAVSTGADFIVVEARIKCCGPITPKPALKSVADDGSEPMQQLIYRKPLRPWLANNSLRTVSSHQQTE